MGCELLTYLSEHNLADDYVGIYLALHIIAVGHYYHHEVGNTTSGNTGKGRRRRKLEGGEEGGGRTCACGREREVRTVDVGSVHISELASGMINKWTFNFV